jgi:murein L,D-transpeptidase YafK
VKFLKAIFFLGALICCVAFAPAGFSFEEIQKKFERVANAYERKEQYLFMKCRAQEIPEETFGNILVRAFKKEEMMEIWVQKPDGVYVKFNEFKIYSLSGKLGPKIVQGDCQVPEGFYNINDFNPVSNYHLSLGINYPNEADLKLYPAPKKGYDIYIHGGHASAGCLAMSNYYVEDIYISAVKAKANGQQKVPVHIYPFKMTEENIDKYSQLPEYAAYKTFWQNLAVGYKIFEKTKHVPDVYVGADGYYQFNDATSVQAVK